jgi:hypothetical protein
MAVSIFDENTPQDGLEFEPFNEAESSAQQRIAYTALSSSLTGAMDTREIDAFRQGVEISTEAHRFKGFGAKIWSGNIKGYTIIRTLGQALSFTEYKNDKRFNDLLIKFDPVAFIELGEEYPYPLVFNEGPQQNKETSIQPFTIPFRNGRDTNEAQETSHDVRGSLEDGNQSVLKLHGFTNRIQQFVPFYNSNQEYSPFLDEGETSFGQTVSGSITMSGYVNGNEVNIVPFDDIGSKKLLSQLTIRPEIITDHSYSYSLSSSLTTFSGTILISSTSYDPVVFTPFSGSLYSAVLNADSGSTITEVYVPATVNGRDFRAFHIGSGFDTNGIQIPALGEPTFRTLTGSCTATFWAYLMPIANWGSTIRNFFSIRGTNDFETANTLFGLAYNFTTKDFYYHHEYGAGTDSITTITNLELSASTWVNLTVVRDYSTSPSGTLSIYQNSVLMKTASLSLSTTPSTGSLGVQTLYIGNGNSIDTLSDSRFTGSLCSFKLIPRALSPSEISYEYLNTPSTVSQTTTSSIITVNSSFIVTQSTLREDNQFLITLQRSSSQIDLDEDIRENYYQKSATAGTDVYGPSMGRAGTDSITYNGWFRGN